MRAAQDQPNLSYRPFKQEDFEPLAGLVAHMWFADAAQRAQPLLGAAELSAHLRCHNWSQVACADGVARAAVLVTLHGREDQRQHWDAVRHSYEERLRQLVGPHETNSQLELIDQEAQASARLESKGKPWADATIELLIVSPSLRGTGVGTRLLHAAGDHLHREGARGFYLMTDDGCDYGYYDHLGYERVYQHESSYPGVANVYAYAHLLRQPQANENADSTSNR
ncbi:MAG: GNAT family N-acetyltransferase [Coriobacteriales bacterium]|nr:GNAT family N-acetyltransferase [Coriobacteriales bacterium]